MTRIQRLIERLPGRASSDDNGDIVLGLPLESGEKTIYPVFLDPGTHPENGSHPRQIGYLEVTDDRSEFTSLEPDDRWPVVLAFIAILLLALAWITLRRTLGEQG